MQAEAKWQVLFASSGEDNIAYFDKYEWAVWFINELIRTERVSYEPKLFVNDLPGELSRYLEYGDLGTT